MGAIANLSASLQWDIDDFQRGTRTIEGAFKGIIGLAGNVADAVANAGRRMTVGMTLPLAGLGVLVTKTAADAAELQSAFDYTFGNMSKSMNRWAEESGDAMGRATSEMQEGALKFGQLFKAAAPTEQAAARLSQRFTELAQDAASFFNTDFETAMGKIRSGLSGESEPLRDFGVFLNEAAVEAKALEMGLIKSGDELNEYGKVMARAALIADGLSDANGDVERTSDSLANQVRKIKGDIQELALEIGEILIPYAQRLAGVVEGLVERFKNLPDGVKRAAVGFGVFLAALGPLSVVLSALVVTVLPLLLVRLGPVFAIISAIINPIGTLVVMGGKLIGSFGGIAAIVSKIAPLFLRLLGPVGLVITALQLFGDDILRGLRAFAGFVSDAIGDGLQTLFASLGATVERVREAFSVFMQTPLGQFLVDLAEFVGFLLEAFLTLAGYLTGQFITAFFEVLTLVADFLGGVVETAVKLLTGDWAGAWDAALQTVGRAIIRIGQWISQLWPWLGGMIEMLGKLTGAEISAPKAPKAPGAGSAGDDDDGGFSGGNYAAPGKTKTPKIPKTPKGARGPKGPSAEELAERREALKLEHELALARESNDLEEIRRLERQRDLRDRIEKYERAGLKAADARIAAEKDMAEIDAARVKAREDFLQTFLVETEYQIAVINNDAVHLRYLDDEAELRERILDLQRAGYDLAQAERIAQDAMLNIEKARADATARRLRDQEQAHELELARLRGDSDASIRAREEEMRIGDRVDELIDDGRMSRAEAEAQAMREAADRSQAHMQGTFRDAFRNGLQAALDGNLGDFFEGWMKERAFNALSNVLDRLADALANLLAGGQQGDGQGGGGFFSTLGSLFSAFGGGGGGGFGSGGPITEGGAMGSFSAIPGGRATALPKWNSGGRGIIKGHPGIDRNLLSINGVPSAFVSRGEQLSVTPQGGGGEKMQVEVVANNNGFGAIVRNQAGQVLAEAMPSMMEGSSQVTQRSMARRQSRRVG